LVTDELDHLLRRMRALTLEVRELEQSDRGTQKVTSKARRLEQLHWRLAAVARATLQERAR
jgi:hypothetical protein